MLLLTRLKRPIWFCCARKSYGWFVTSHQYSWLLLNALLSVWSLIIHRGKWPNLTNFSKSKKSPYFNTMGLPATTHTYFFISFIFDARIYEILVVSCLEPSSLDIIYPCGRSWLHSGHKTVFTHHLSAEIHRFKSILQFVPFCSYFGHSFRIWVLLKEKMYIYTHLWSFLYWILCRKTGELSSISHNHCGQGKEAWHPPSYASIALWWIRYVTKGTRHLFEAGAEAIEMASGLGYSRSYLLFQSSLCGTFRILGRWVHSLLFHKLTLSSFSLFR